MKGLIVTVTVAMLGILALGTVASVRTNTQNHQLEVPQAGTTGISAVQTTPTARNVADYVASITPASGITDAMVIPLYPNAENAESFDSNLPSQSSRVKFFTGDSLAQISAFYDAVLGKIGWTHDSTEQRSNWLGKSFRWPDEQGQLPFRLILNVTAADECYLDVGGSRSAQGKRCVETGILKQPLAGRIPMYPGAENVRVTDKANSLAFFTRSLDFETGASPEEILDFYKTRLPAFGWSLDGELSRSHSGSHIDVVFLDPIAGAMEYNQGTVRLTARSSNSQVTQVNITLDGPDLRNDSAPQK